MSGKEMALLGAILPVAIIAAGFDSSYTAKEVVEDLRREDFNCNNAKYKYKVEFNRENELCTVNLKVKVKQNILDNGTSTKVVQKYRPVCN